MTEPVARKKWTDEERKAYEERQRRREAAAKKQQEIWGALVALIHKQHDAWLVSPPGSATLRIEALPHSEVPAQLMDLGFRLSPCGSGQRITDRIRPVQIFEFSIPLPR